MATNKRGKKDVSVEPEANKELLTNERLEDLKGSWEAMYNDPAFNKEQLLNCIRDLTDRVLAGEFVVEKA